MQLIPHSPTDGVYPATGDYVHAMEVRGAQRLLFVAGTIGLDHSGTPGATLDERIQAVRGHGGQADVARVLLGLATEA